MKIGKFVAIAIALLLASAPVHSLGASEAQAGEKVDIITPHITDGDHMEVPWILPPFFKEIHLPKYEALQFHVGGLEVDLSPTKHVYFLLIGATLLILVMTAAARSQVRAAQAGQAPKGHRTRLKRLSSTSATRSSFRTSGTMVRASSPTC